MTKINHIFRISDRARNISLRPDFENNQVIITLPNFRAEKKGLEFFHKKESWISRQFKNYQTKIKHKIKIEPDEKITICGVEYILKSHKKAGVFAEDGILFVSGNELVFENRVRRFAKKLLEKYAKKEAKILAKRLEKKISEVKIKSLKSRWGSCSSNAILVFAEQLAFAPKHVIDYLIAHEVAHLEEMNHSASFWNLVGKLYYDNPETAKSWLKVYGKTL